MPNNLYDDLKIPSSSAPERASVFDLNQNQLASQLFLRTPIAAASSVLGIPGNIQALASGALNLLPGKETERSPQIVNPLAVARRFGYGPNAEAINAQREHKVEEFENKMGRKPNQEELFNLTESVDPLRVPYPTSHEISEFTKSMLEPLTGRGPLEPSDALGRYLTRFSGDAPIIALLTPLSLVSMGAGALASAAAQTAEEFGAGPWGQLIASLTPAGAKFGFNAVHNLVSKYLAKGNILNAINKRATEGYNKVRELPQIAVKPKTPPPPPGTPPAGSAPVQNISGITEDVYKQVTENPSILPGARKKIYDVLNKVESTFEGNPPPELVDETIKGVEDILRKDLRNNPAASRAIRGMRDKIIDQFATSSKAPIQALEDQIMSKIPKTYHVNEPETKLLTDLFGKLRNNLSGEVTPESYMEAQQSINHLLYKTPSVANNKWMKGLLIEMKDYLRDYFETPLREKNPLAMLTLDNANAAQTLNHAMDEVGAIAKANPQITAWNNPVAQAIWKAISFPGQVARSIATKLSPTAKKISDQLNSVDAQRVEQLMQVSPLARKAVERMPGLLAAGKDAFDLSAFMDLHNTIESEAEKMFPSTWKPLSNSDRERIIQKKTSVNKPQKWTPITQEEYALKKRS